MVFNSDFKFKEDMKTMWQLRNFIYHRDLLLALASAHRSALQCF